MDQAEKELTDIISLSKENDIYKQEIKHKLNTMRRHAEYFRNTLNAAFKNNPQGLEQFGEESDKLEEIIKRELFIPIMNEIINQ
jgi:predicted  nucleic acid-binding Zn-ribbon protein